LKIHADRLRAIVPRLDLMLPHEALFLYRNCLAMPKWLHLLRSSSPAEASSLEEIDDI
jgi:hypothetical protein